MPGSATPQSDAATHRDLFATTHWSVILRAAGPDSGEGRLALDELCRAYWQPLFIFIRSRGYTETDAKDLTQQFLLEIIRRRDINGLQPVHGRFRAFLLASLKHFLSNQLVRERAQKRGGRSIPIPLPDESRLAEAILPGYVALPPDRAYDRAWAIEILNRVVQILRSESIRKGRQTLFDDLKGTLSSDAKTAPYSEVAVRHGLSEGAIKVHVHRLKVRYREVLREEIGRTIEDPREIDEEIRTLIEALG